MTFHQHINSMREQIHGTQGEFYLGVFSCISEKMRIPSWTDRILVNNDLVIPLYYNRIELNQSDHKPVKAIFTINVEREAKRNEGYEVGNEAKSLINEAVESESELIVL